ncbi:zeta-sarcoglycan isoform X2 [Strigops habroptila]|uniref:zeta-sarcoglycan isoform X2 n=1 Tax=Strigops habroptila TaxID=2489341 RepID=UPI0011CFF21F|nr:zeta-sarcoglycan isoform X2 [Strigops habroptila]
MDRSANLDTEELKMTREQYILATQQNSLPRTEHPQFYPVGIYGWRKRCLYFFVLLLLVTMIVNLAMTIWILKVMNFTVDSPLVLQSDRNVTVNARNHMGQLTGQLTVGADAVEAQSKRFEVRASEGGKILFSADEDEIVIGADRLKVTGTEGAVFGHSVETPHIRAEPSQDLKLESPTRSLVMEAPRGVQVNAAAGDLKATCRKELHLQSTEGEIFLNADTIRLGNLPVGSFSSSSSSPSSTAPRQTIYELCVCPNAFCYYPSASQFCSVSLVTSSTLQTACRATSSSVSRNTALPSLVVCVATQRRDGSEIFRNQCILHQETWNIISPFVRKGE